MTEARADITNHGTATFHVHCDLSTGVSWTLNNTATLTVMSTVDFSPLLQQIRASKRRALARQVEEERRELPPVVYELGVHPYREVVVRRLGEAPKPGFWGRLWTNVKGVFSTKGATC